MFRNYLKTAIRNLWKNKFYSSLNIVGLAAGLAICMVILLYVIDELSFDRYNKDADRIFRVNNEVKFGGNHFDLATGPAPMAQTLKMEFPQVEQVTRIRWYGGFLVRKGNENLSENRVGSADSTLFDVFSIPMIEGDPKTALANVRSLVVTESIAKKYFNRTNVVGQTLTINNTESYKITGVIKDFPTQSHFRFDFLVPMAESEDSRETNWLSENFNTYIKLHKKEDAAILEPQLNGMMDRHTGPELKAVANMDLDQFKKDGGLLRASLTPLLNIHLRSNKMAELEANGNIQYVYIFSAIAIFILVIACVNFMNLATARSANRAKEVGVRKVLGSLRKNLVQQFLSESMLLSVISLALAGIIAYLILPYFNQVAGKSVSVSTLLQPRMLLILLALIFLVGFLAGSYPAFYLSSFRPIDVLKGKLASGFKRSWLRNSLVVFQFFISIALIIGTIVIYKQLSYIRSKDLGYSRSQILIINNTGALRESATSFRNELMQISGVKAASLSGYLPTNYNRSNDAFFTSPALDSKTAMSMQNWGVDENYLGTLDLKLIAGRNFTSDMKTDSNAIIINEAAAKFLATKDILNKKLYRFEDLTTKRLGEYHIIGVIKNFNFSSLREVVTPLSLGLKRSTGNISVRISSDNVPGLIDQIKAKWKSIAPAEPFDYTFMDEQFNNQYTAEVRTGQLFIGFAVLAILIACLGLFGLVTYAAEQRTKEIGIRKVVGANVIHIVSMIAKDFLKLILIASLIAFPVAWWAMHKWLQDFAYRSNLSWWIFALAGGIALLIALLTISYQSIKAATANPVKSLRTE